MVTPEQFPVNSTGDLPTFYDPSIVRPDLPEGIAWLGRKLRVLDAQGLGAYTPEERMLYALAFAGVSAFTHNCPPGRFRMEDGNRVGVYLDRMFVLHGSDPEGRQAVISTGAMIENLVQAAGVVGRSVVFEGEIVNQTQVTPMDVETDTRMVRLGTLQFDEAESVGSTAILDLMLQRKSVRGEFTREIFSEEQELQVISEVGSETGLGVHVVRGQMPIFALSKLQEKGMTAAITQERFSLELAEWMLANDQTTFPAGMRGSEFGLEAEATGKMREKMKGDANALTAQELLGFARNERDKVASSSAVVAISVPTEDRVVSWLQAGKAYQQMSLRLTRMGWSHQMHAALTETALARPIKALQMGFLGTYCGVSPMDILQARRELAVLFRIGKLRFEEDKHRIHAAKPVVGSLMIG